MSALRRFVVPIFAAVLLVAAAGTAGAAIEPPWCGTPEPDVSEGLSGFPHIPYYAVGCTLDSIAARSNGRMSVEVIGESALGRDMYLVTINALDTVERRQAYHNWQEVRRIALIDPVRAQGLVARAEGAIKVPLFIQGGIHGNEYEGVDASMQLIERLATTPNGADPEVDAILDNSVVLFNPIQNPDGRVLGQRANGNGFDLNRDFLTQSQSETKASISIMQAWLPPDMLDLHGYTSPTLIEATTKPHNPSIEYDLWLKWNQARIDANEAAMNAAGMQVQRPINDWCSDASLPPCPPGETHGPAEAEGWDDWGPFYTPMYAQHIGLNGSTVEMCMTTACGGRLGARTAQYVISWSTLLFDVANRSDLIHDQLEIYNRGIQNAPRPACCPPPFDVDNNWMTEFPRAYVIPRGAGQRSDPEASRLVQWLLDNQIEVHELKQDAVINGQRLQNGSYVVWMTQARRGLADTALSIGVDVTPRIGILYAPPAAWSHGYLWGANVITIPRDAASFMPQTNRVLTPNNFGGGGLEPGPADRYALKIDSPTAVRTVNDLVGQGTLVQIALASFATASGETMPAGSAVFGGDSATKTMLASVGRNAELVFRRVRTNALPALEAVERVPRIAVLVGGIDQNIWTLRNLGFTADPVSPTTINTATTDPLANYDVIYNTGNWPTQAALVTARARLTAFFASGGGYIGAGTGGASFLTTGAQVTGLTAASRGGSGRSGIVRWNNEGGAASVVTGAYPSEDTAIMDPPTWFTSVPATMSVDGRFPATNFFLAGLWPMDGTSVTAPNSAVIAHGTNTAGTSRMTVFAMNPLYRADPEREWPMVATAAYWGDR